MHPLLQDYLSTKEYLADMNESGYADYNTKIETRKELRDMEAQMRAMMPEGTEWDSKEGLMFLGLSNNQASFVLDAWKHDLIVFPYSGRGMFGVYCPAVKSDNSLPFGSDCYTDSLGRSIVHYARY